MVKKRFEICNKDFVSVDDVPDIFNYHLEKQLGYFPIWEAKVMTASLVFKNVTQGDANVKVLKSL